MVCYRDIPYHNTTLYNFPHASLIYAVCRGRALPGPGREADGAGFSAEAFPRCDWPVAVQAGVRGREREQVCRRRRVSDSAGWAVGGVPGNAAGAG